VRQDSSTTVIAAGQPLEQVVLMLHDNSRHANADSAPRKCEISSDLVSHGQVDS